MHHVHSSLENRSSANTNPRILTVPSCHSLSRVYTLLVLHEDTRQRKTAKPPSSGCHVQHWTFTSRGDRGGGGQVIKTYSATWNGLNMGTTASTREYNRITRMCVMHRRRVTWKWIFAHMHTQTVNPHQLVNPFQHFSQYMEIWGLMLTFCSPKSWLYILINKNRRWGTDCRSTFRLWSRSLKVAKTNGEVPPKPGKCWRSLLYPTRGISKWWK